MSTSALPPTAPTTLVIMLGASAWPNSPGFQASQAFVRAARGFRAYLLDPHGFGLPAANLFDLFDATFGASDQLEMLGSFLDQRAQALKAVNHAVRDVLVYFVGHGGFAGPSADFYLLQRRAHASGLRASGIAIDALAEVLREKARQARRYLFLDCCFAAAAFHSFQGAPDQTAITKTLDAFAVQARSNGFPRKGTVLLCSSDQKSPSLLLPDQSCTMFSHALLDVLRNGDLHRPPRLSLRDLKELAEHRLATLPEKNAPRPGLYSPDQSEGDAADIPFFPNPSINQASKQRHRLVNGPPPHSSSSAVAITPPGWSQSPLSHLAGQQAGREIQSPASQPRYKPGRRDVLAWVLTIGLYLVFLWPAIPFASSANSYTVLLALVLVFVLPFVMGITSVVLARRKGFDGLVSALISSLAGAGVYFLRLIYLNTPPSTSRLSVSGFLFMEAIYTFLSLLGAAMYVGIKRLQLKSRLKKIQTKTPF